MNGLDAAVLAVVLAFIAMGVFRGFLGELLSMFVWIFAVLLAWMYSERVAPYFKQLDEEVVRQGLAFVVVFVAVFLLFTVVTLVLRKMFLRSVVDSVDRTLGGVVGLARGLLIVVVVLFLSGLTPFPHSDSWRESALMPYLSPLVVKLQARLPEAVASQFRFS